LNTSRLLGGALGLAVLSTIADSHTSSQLARGASSLGALTSGYQLALGVGALISLLGAFLTVVLLRPRATGIAVEPAVAVKPAVALERAGAVEPAIALEEVDVVEAAIVSTCVRETARAA
jgi:hypothetical protein